MKKQESERMSLVNLNVLLRHAQENRYAVGNFDVCDSTLLMGVLTAAERNRSPIILAYGADFQKNTPIRIFSKMLREAAEQTDIPICIHWDHATSMGEIDEAIACGFTSVMIDASAEPFQRNVSLTKEVVAMCRDKNISVEAELGQVGTENADYDIASYRYTDPEEAVEFAARTGIDALAIAVGNAHGVYASTPQIDVELVDHIRKRVDVPLVLHGASGIGDSDIVKCIHGGITKINIFTELCQVASRCMTDSFAHGEKYNLAVQWAIAAVACRTEEKMRLFDCCGRC